MRLIIVAALALAATPAVAQTTPQGPVVQQAKPGSTIFDDNWVTIGLGGAYGPSYEGSDDYVFFPAPALRGSVSGFDFGSKGPGLYIDLIREREDSKIEFILGPVARARFNRKNQIKDPVVRSLGKLDTAIEVGATAGVAFKKLLNPFDTLTVQVDGLWDVAKAHRGRIITPSIGYATPLSQAVFATVSISAEHVDDDYADYYFSVTPAGSAVSGLPVFQADGGWKSAGGSLLLAYDLSGDVRDGGWGLFALGSYSKMLEDAKRTPLTSIRGDKDQWFIAAGVTYTF